MTLWFFVYSHGAFFNVAAHSESENQMFRRIGRKYNCADWYITEHVVRNLIENNY